MIDAAALLWSVANIMSRILPTLTLLLASSIATPAADLRLKVEAGEHPRNHSIIHVQDPGNLPDRPALEAADGTRLPIQRADDGTFSFILPGLAAGASAEFKLIALPEEPAALASATEAADQITLMLGTTEVATYRGGRGELPRENIDPVYLRGGYLHPLLTPSGRMVTDDYPANHVHHHGIWMAWTKTNFEGRSPDFWNMAAKKGTVEAVSIDHHWSGPVHAGLDANHRHIDLTSGEPVPVLDEIWSVRVYATGGAPYHLIELRSEQRMASESKLELPTYHYGGLGVRGHATWDGKDNARFLTSEGTTARTEANSQPARWIHMGGGDGPQSAGIAVLSHPENFRSPQPVRVHPEEPFLSFAPQNSGDMEIGHATAYVSRYRFVAMDGKADESLLEQLWNDYAHPPVVSWIED
jgi:hypothetical protein